MTSLRRKKREKMKVRESVCVREKERESERGSMLTLQPFQTDKSKIERTIRHLVCEKSKGKG